MRIFCAVRHSNDPAKFYGGLWSSNFYPALRDLGHEIVESQVDLLPTSRFMDIPGGFTARELEQRARTTEQILSEVRAAHEKAPLDVFLSYFYNAHFDPAGFDELRRLGIPSVNFFCNSVHQFNLVAAVAAKVDFSWHAERDVGPSYAAVGGKPVWVPMGADPHVYRPISGVMRRATACFIGQQYSDRDRWLAALVRNGVPVDIYGGGWSEAADVPELRDDTAWLDRPRPVPGTLGSYTRMVADNIQSLGMYGGLRRVGRQIAYRRTTRKLRKTLAPHTRGRARDMAAVVAGYEVCLNLSNVWEDGRPGSRLISHVRLRDFEGPMCRTCFLTGHTDEIGEYYDLGREIETYSSPAEFVDKVRFYLSHPAQAETLRDAGYRRAIHDHTWQRRFVQLFSKTGLSSPAVKTR